MADKKISALTSATTPLAGTEVLPIVQSGATVKVAVSDLTAGRAISATAVTASTGNFVVGTSGQGVDFSATPGTGTSELLDDYETGSWTPALSSNAGSAGAAAVSNAYGIYTKVGNQVTISFSFKVDNVGSWSGAIQVAGIPFNFASGKFVIAATAVSNLTYSGQVAFEGAISAGDKLTLRTMATASAYSQVNVSGISAGNTVFYGTLTYYV
jgi:hypothetical protein